MKELFLKRYFLPQNLVYYALVTVIAFGLKYHYSHATIDNLIWVLAPTASLVEMVLPVDFELEKGQGFIDKEQNIIIAPACAGVNFMIISYCMAAFCGIYRLSQTKEIIFWLFFSLAAAFVLTLVINASRIILSAHLYEYGFNMGWFTPSRIHLAAGVFIYIFCLYGIYFAAQLILDKYRAGLAKKKSDRTKTTLLSFAGNQDLKILIPLIWYLLMTLGIPLITGWHKKNTNLFAEYTAVVIIICLFACLTFFCFRLFYMKLKDKIAIRTTKSRLYTLLYPDNSNKLQL